MITQKINKAGDKAGFTLIELSIVLVIIGLIVGGVLVGQDLIRAAELRSTISQIERYNVAANTFQGKYDGLPGDMTGAATFGFSTGNSGDLTADGDGLVEGDAADPDSTAEEIAAFFHHMTQAEMTSEPVTGNATAGYDLADCDDESLMFPLSKYGKGVRVWAASHGGQNHFYLANWTIEDGVVSAAGEALTPLAAFNFDSKLDDGLPLAGIVQVYEDIDTAGADESGGGAAAGECVNGTAYYTDNTTTQNVAGCTIRSRASF